MAFVVEELEKLRLANAQAVELLNHINAKRKQGAPSQAITDSMSDRTEKKDCSEMVPVTMNQIDDDMELKGQNAPYDIWGCQEYLHQSERLSFVREYLKSSQDLIDKNSKLMSVTKPASYEVVDDVESLLQAQPNTIPSRRTEPIFLPQSSPSTARTDYNAPQLDEFIVNQTQDTSLTEDNLRVTTNEQSRFFEPAVPGLHSHTTPCADTNDIPFEQFHVTEEQRTVNETVAQIPSSSSQHIETSGEYINTELPPTDIEHCKHVDELFMENAGHCQRVDELLIEDNQLIPFHDQNKGKSTRRLSVKPTHFMETLDADNPQCQSSARPELISLLLEMESSPHLDDTANLRYEEESKPRGMAGDTTASSSTIKKAGETPNSISSKMKPSVGNMETPKQRGSLVGDTLMDVSNPTKKSNAFKCVRREAFVPRKEPTLVRTVDDTHITLRHIKGKILKAAPRESFSNLSQFEKPNRDLRCNAHATNQPHHAASCENHTPLFVRRADAKWELLPDEMVVQIFSYLTNKDLKALSLVNRRFHRIAKDSYLWQTVTANGIEIDNQWLERVEAGKVKHVHLQKCSSKSLQARYLRVFFQNCRHSLQSIHVSECRHDPLSGDNILLHVSSRCANVRRMSIPWSNASNNGISALASSDIVLKELDVSGNCGIADEAFVPFVSQKGHALRTLKMSGCFALTNNALAALGRHCINLEVLHIGMCAKVTADCVTGLCSSLGKLRSVDFRGLKSVTDQCLASMSKNCKSLTDIVLANCSYVTDRGIIELTSELSKITHLDVSGCSGVTDSSVTALAFSLSDIQSLNISNTGISYLSVDALTEHCLHCLRTLKISFCSNITNDCVRRLVSFCYNLRCLHIHGCKRVKTGELLSNTSNCLEICF